MPSRSRREFLTRASLAALAVLAGCKREPQGNGTDPTGTQDLAALVYAIFPHDDVDRRVYVEVAVRMQHALEAEPAWQSLRQDGMHLLNSLGGEEWGQLDSTEQAAILRTISGTRFFGTVYRAALVEFYSHPEVWKLLGYPGASSPQGGYLHRGFDDIGWLPESPPP